MHRQNPFETPNAPGVDPSGARPGGGGSGTFDIGRCLSEAWEACWANFPLWLGVGAVAIIVYMLSAITVIGIFIVLPVLAWGGAKFLLNMYDRKAEFNDLFSGFSRFGQAWVSMVVLMLCFIAIYIVPYGLQIGGAYARSSIMTGLGGLLSLGIVFGVLPRLTFAYFYIVDRGMGGVDALKASWDATRSVWVNCVLLMLLTVVITFAGMIALVVGVIPASVVAYLMFASAYRQMAG